MDLDCCLPEERRLQNAQSKKIDKLIKKSKDNIPIKLLLLGTGESGKSTFIRQMRIIYDNGYSDEEKMEYVKVIMQNILTSMHTMVAAMSFLNIDYELERNVTNADVIKKADCESFVRFPDMYLVTIKELWADAGFQVCYRRRREYHLTDSTKYYLDNIDRIAERKYMPTEDDILHVRVPTTGLVEYQFKVKNVDFRMMDVGGQRSERKKWMHCFDNVKAIIFLVAISEYDQVLQESDQRNRLIESRNVFKSIANYEWFNGTSIALFFNKTDLLQEKIMYSDLVTYFPNFRGPKNDYDAAKEFIHEMFIEVMPQKKIYRHYTCATDTQNIKFVFKIVRDAILREYLGRFGVL